MSGVEDKLEDLPDGPRVQVGGGGWRGARVLRQWFGASGIPSGMNGPRDWRTFWWGLAAIAGMVAAFNTVNVTSVVHDRPDIGLAAPIVWEASSWSTFVLFAVIPWLALQAAPFSLRPRWRFAAVHLPALVAFSFLHVTGFVLIRQAVYRLAGDRYGVGPLGDFPYEFRKDILGYSLALLAFWIVARQLAVVVAPQPAAERALFDIRDGARLIRVRLAEILAVTSAGNYVEFVLEDGRRPLMRAPLSAMEEELTPRGFVRTHRSWLVNGAKVSGLAPEGSGDYRIELGALAVPLSRRFPKALAALRGEAPTSPRA